MFSTLASRERSMLSASFLSWFFPLNNSQQLCLQSLKRDYLFNFHLYRVSLPPLKLPLGAQEGGCLCVLAAVVVFE